MPVRPKVIYVAKRNPALSPAAFQERWRAHGALAMGLPIWRNMWKYAQSDPLPVAGIEPDCDAIGLVWYRGWDALDAIAARPALRQPLLDDELLTFAGHVRECALMTEETVLQAGTAFEYKVFVFGSAAEAVERALGNSARVGRIARSDAVHNAYTTASRLQHEAVYEAWYPDARDAETALGEIGAQLRDAPLRMMVARERPLYGPAPDA